MKMLKVGLETGQFKVLKKKLIKTLTQTHGVDLDTKDNFKGYPYKSKS